MPNISTEKINLIQKYQADGLNSQEIAKKIRLKESTVEKHLIKEKDTFVEDMSHEFDNIPDDIIEIKDLFYHIREQEKLTKIQLEQLREIYEERLNQLIKTQPIKEAIKSFKSRYKLNYCPVHREAEDWNEDRLYTHLIYWYVANKESKRIANAKLEELDSLDKKREFFDNLN